MIPLSPLARRLRSDQCDRRAWFGVAERAIMSRGMDEETDMKAITVQADVTVDNILRIEVPCDIPPGQVSIISGAR